RAAPLAVAILGRHGGRPPLVASHDEWHGKPVAILGRHGGRPPPSTPPPSTTASTCCDPRPSRRTAATRQAFPQRPRGRPVAILGRHGGRPPLARRFRSAHPEDLFRSSAVTEDGRHLTVPAPVEERGDVAILGRHGGRPPPPHSFFETTATPLLRSSAVTEDGRHLHQ